MIETNQPWERESASRYRAYFEASNDALFVEDHTGRILEVNARACDLLGYSREELLRLTVADLIPPDAPQYLSESEAGAPFTRLRLKTYKRHKNGQVLPVEVSGRQIELGGEQVWLINVRDIGERRQLEQALAERSAQLTWLNQLAKALSGSLDVERIAQIAVDRVRAIAGLDAVGLVFIGEAPDERAQIFYSGVSDTFVAQLVARNRLVAKLVGQVAALGYPLIIDDMRLDVNLPSRMRRLTLDEDLRTVALFPVSGGGRVQGMLAVGYRDVLAIDDVIVQLLEAATGQVGQALANAWLFQSERRRVEAQETLIDTLRIAIGTLRLSEMLPALAEQASRLLQADGAYITRWRDTERLTIPTAASGPYSDMYPTLARSGSDEPTLTRAVLEAQRPIAVHDVFNTPHIDPAFAAQFSTRSLLGLPLIAHGRRLGALLIASDTPRRFRPAEMELGELAANLIALAIDNAQLLETEERQRRQAETLRQVTASLTSSLDVDAVLNSMLDQLGRVVSYDSASIQLFRDGALEIVAGRGFPDLERAKRAARSIAIGARARTMVATRRALLIPDTQADPGWVSFPGQEYIRSWLGAPLFERDELIGVLNVDSRQVNAYDEEVAAVVTSFAHQAAIAITNARLYQEELDRVAHLAVLNDIVRIASSTLDPGQVYQALADNMIRVIGGDECHITRWDEDAQRPIPAAAYGPSKDTYLSMTLPPGIGASLTSHVLQAGRPLAVEDVFHSPYSNAEIAGRFSSISRLALPLIADGRKLGAVLIGFTEKRRFSEEEVARAGRAAELVAVAAAKAQLYADLQQYAQDLESEVQTRTHELRSAYEQLRSLDRLKSQLITQIGHEFRTPVANLNTYLRLLASGRREKREHYLSVLGEQTEALKRLIETVTVFAEVDLAPQARPYEPWPIERAIEASLSGCLAEARAKSIDVELDRSGVDLQVRASLQRVTTALDEILSNAVAYTDDGGRVTIRVDRIEEEGRRWLRISVTDTGIGIPADELPRVFDQFFRGKQRALQVRGIGMGLSLVHAIVEAEAGRVTAESEGIGQGSTFRLWLPEAE